MKKVRAIYVGDIRFANCPIFELKENGWFEMLENPEFRYKKEVVETDDSWLIFNASIDEDSEYELIKEEIKPTLMQYNEPEYMCKCGYKFYTYDWKPSYCTCCGKKFNWEDYVFNK